MFMIEMIGALLLYYEGYMSYCQGKIACTFLFTLGCAACLLLFLRHLWCGRYVFMRMKKIDKLSGQAFEDYLIVQFRRAGYRVRDTRTSHDYGADLLLKKRGETIVVQAKRYDRNIGIAAVQEAIGAVAYYEADRAMVVTNRYFTKSAKNLASRNEVELWGRDEIIKKFKIRE